MRKSGAAPPSMPLPASLRTESAAGHRTPRRRVTSASLLVLLGLAHDFLRGEVDAAGREGVADEEVVGLVRVVVLRRP